MSLSFAARIDGNLIRCLISSDQPIAAPVFCFSLITPAVVVSGGTMVRSLAGYCEVALPDLTASAPHEVVLRHLRDFRPANRAWLPLGAYLRTKQGCQPLPRLPNGVQSHPSQACDPCPGLRLVPPPNQWTPGPRTLAVAQGFASTSPLLAGVDALAGRTRLGPFLSPSGAVLTLTPDLSLPAEGYRLDIMPAGIALYHADAAGAFYGGITLLQLRQTHQNTLPCGRIEDAPRFGWRGQHLDCARHFYQTGTIERLLDLMALFKLNRFHWHFADDEAFRLEVDCAPDLWRNTAMRGEGEMLPGLFGGGIRAGGSYSKADVAALVVHAARLHIAILPEIEVPAHSFALNRAILGLRDPGGNSSEVSIHGYPENIVNPAMPKTMDFIGELAREVAGLFPIGILHLGCDELPPHAWDGSPEVAALKALEGLQTPEDVQGWMMRRLATGLAAAGIRSAAWEEAAKGVQGGIGTNAILFSWTGQGPGIAAARAGHDVVMCPAQHAYFDMAHSADPQDWGAAWAGFTDLEQALNWSPIPESAPDIAPKVIGVQGCYWSEFTTLDEEIEPMLAPRILALATKAWERDRSTDAPRLRALAGALAPLFARIGWRQHHRA